MTQVIEFIQKFLSAEYTVQYAMLTEPDNDKYLEIIAAYQNYLAFEVDMNEAGIYRPSQLEADWFSQQADQAEDIAPRRLFLIRTYQHPEHGLIYRCYTSSEWKNHMNYSAVFYIGQVDQQFKVIARYLVNRSKGCDWYGGKKISAKGKFVEVQRFMAPVKSPRDIADYESEKGTI